MSDCDALSDLLDASGYRIAWLSDFDDQIVAVPSARVLIADTALSRDDVAASWLAPSGVGDRPE